MHAHLTLLFLFLLHRPGLTPESNDVVDPDEAVALGAAVQVGSCGALSRLGQVQTGVILALPNGSCSSFASLTAYVANSASASAAVVACVG